MNINQEQLLHWHRLGQTLHVLSVHVSIPLRILHTCAHERIREVWEDYAKNPGKSLGAPPLGDLSDLIESVPPSPESMLAERIDERLLDWFCPLPDAHSPIPSQEISCLDDNIFRALWHASPPLLNPYHTQLKEFFPRLRALYRLHHVRCSYQFQGNTTSKIVTCPSGLSEFLLSIPPSEKGNLFRHKGGIIVGGLMWLEENFPHPERTMSVRLETAVKNALEQLETHCGTSAKRLLLGFEQRAHLLRLVTAEPVEMESGLKDKVSLASRVLNDLCTLSAECEDRSLNTSEWTELVRWLLFSRLAAMNVNSCVACQAVAPWGSGVLFDGRLEVFHDLSKYSCAVRTTFNITPESIEEGTESVLFSLTDAEPHNESTSWNPGVERIAKMADLLHDWYRSFKAAGDGIGFHLEQLFAERLQYTLHHLPFSDTPSLMEHFVRRARTLVSGDVAAYLNFNGPENRLEPAVLVRRGYLRNASYETEQEGKVDTQRRFREFLENMARDPQRAIKSSTYRCLDQSVLVSRFTEHKSAEKDAPFLSDQEVEEVRSTALDDAHWYIAEKDTLTVPVLFHGRRQGVLHIAAATTCRFMPEDRLRLLEFVRIFQSEFFEARLLGTLRDMNRDLLSALAGRLDRGQLCDELAERVAQLLGAHGVTLWWRSEHPEVYLELIGRAGPQITEVFGDQCFGTRRDPLLSAIRTEGSGDRVELVSNLEQHGTFGKRLAAQGLASCVGVAIKNARDKFGGIMLVHDSKVDPRLSEPFYAEIPFLAARIGQMLTHYHTHTAQINEMRLFVGHDVRAALREIDGSRSRLIRYMHNVPKQQRRDYEKCLEDIEHHVQLGRDLVDFLTDQKIQRELNLLGTDPLLAFIFHLGLFKTLSRPTQLDEPIRSVLHSLSPEMKKRQVVFASQHIGELIWVHERILREVLSNLIVNAVKYAKPKSRITVYSEKTPAELNVIISNTASPLTGEAAATPALVFGKGARFSGRERQPRSLGEGRGLYISREIAGSWGGDIRLKYTPGDPWARYEFVVAFPLWLTMRDNPWLH